MTFLDIIINIGADPSGTHLKSQYSEGWGGEIPRCRSDNTRPHLKKNNNNNSSSHKKHEADTATSSAFYFYD